MLSTTGCGEPDCSVSMSLSGAIDEFATFDSVGENLCSAELLSGLVIIDFYKELTTGDAGVSNLQVNVQSPTLVAGTFPATVVVGTASFSYTADASACIVTISALEREDWTVTDYVNFTAVLSCNAPLTGIGGGGGSVDLGPTTFTGHVLYAD